jgi:hypothetical protein
VLSYVVAVRVLVALTFAVAAGGKVRRFGAFAASLAPLSARPRNWRPVAALVVAAEAATVVLVAVPPVAAAGLALAAALLACFCVGIAVALRRGRRVTCRCFGAAGGPLGRTHLVRNGLLLAAAASALPRATVPAPLAGSLPAVLVGAFLALLVIHWDELAGLLATRARV